MEIGSKVTGKQFDLENARIVGEVTGMSKEDFEAWYESRYDVKPKDVQMSSTFSGRLFASR